MCVELGVTKTRSEYLISVFILMVMSFYNFNHVDARDTKKVATHATVMRKTCLLKPDEGPCRAKILMYYFDPEIGKCNKFKWGGCQGNGNRFDSKEECYKSCYREAAENTKVRPRYCSLQFDYGYCFGAVSRYYYDPLWKVCKERIYSGCGGNKNNFYNIDQCDSVCRFGNGFLQHNKMRREKDKIRKQIIINPRSATKLDKNKRVTTLRTKHKVTKCRNGTSKSGKDGSDGD